MPVSFSLLPLAETNQKNSEFKDKKIELVSFPDTLSLEIASFSYLEIEELEKIFYSLYNKLFYLFNYLDYRVKFSSFPEIDKSKLQIYLNFLYFNPFL